MIKKCAKMATIDDRSKLACKGMPTKTTYQGAKNSTIQSSLLLSTSSSKFLEFNSTEELDSDFSFEPPVVFPFNRSFNSAFICQTMQ